MRRPERLGATIAVLYVALLALVLPGEVAHYRHVLGVPRDGGPPLVVLAVVASQTAGLLTPGLVCGWLAARRSRAWVALGVAMAWAMVCVALLRVDHLVHRLAGNHLLDYLAFVGQPEIAQWGNVSAAWLAPLGRSGGTAGLLTAGAAAIAVLASRLGVGARRRTRVGLAGAWAVVLCGPFLIGGAVAWPAAYARLEEALPFRWDVGARRAGGASSLDAEATAVYREHDRGGDTVGSPLEALRRAHVATTPDIVLVVLESFRHDVLTSAVMPRVWAWSRKGARFEHHLSSSNASSHGFFGLLYGFAPLDYFRTVAAGIAPTLPALLAERGYERLLIASSTLEWCGMRRFMGPPYFDVHVEQDAPVWERDRHAVAAARRALAEPGHPPRLLLVYLMASHFPYEYPPAGEVFVPAAPAPSMLDGALVHQRRALLNRYRNSVRYLDGLLGDWLEQVDLDHTIVLVTGDHGESLFDDGTLAHSSRLSSIQTRVPLVVAGPGVPAGTVVTRLTAHADVVPTLLELTGAARAELMALPGTSVLAPRDEAPAYASVIQAAAEELPRTTVLLASDDRRYAVRLNRPRRRLAVLGAVDEMGDWEAMGEAEPGGGVLRAWLADYLARSLKR
ncbi:MAG: sulfatase-like hydrolase/transferase [Candidatus Binatia bacterium]